MMSAYMDDNDYYYRINDDTIMSTDGWTEKFIEKLSEYDPPNVVELLDPLIPTLKKCFNPGMLSTDNYNTTFKGYYLSKTTK